MTIEVPAAERYRIDLNDKRGTFERRARLLVAVIEAWLENEAGRLAGIPGIGAIDEAALVLEQALNALDAHYLTCPV